MAKPLKQITFEFTDTEDLPVIDTPLESGTAHVTTLTEPLPELRKKTEKKPSSPSNSKRGRRSLKDTGIEAGPLRVPEDEVLFQKQYYAIGEVATMFNENQSLIRYWETEFDILQPRKNRKGDRFFRPIDIKNLVLIYDLLRRRKITI